MTYVLLTASLAAVVFMDYRAGCAAARFIRVRVRSNRKLDQ
jgi:hypothetical protein